MLSIVIVLSALVAFLVVALAVTLHIVGWLGRELEATEKRKQEAEAFMDSLICNNSRLEDVIEQMEQRTK